MVYKLIDGVIRFFADAEAADRAEAKAKKQPPTKTKRKEASK